MQRKVVLLLRNLFIFTLPVALAYAWLEHKLGQVPNSYNKKRYALEKQLPAINVLITGSSQSLYGLNPQYFSSYAFNIANSSQTFFYDRAITLKYLPELKSLKCVIIPVSYFSFFYELSDTKEEWRDFYYYHFWHTYNPNLPLLDFRRFSLAATYTPPVVLKLARNWFKKDLDPTLLDNGAMVIGAGSEQEINDTTGRLRVFVHNSMRIPGHLQQIQDELEDFVKTLRMNHIKVLFITPPVYITYARFCDPLVLQQNNEIIAGLCHKYDCSSASCFNDSTFSRNEFADNDHLDDLGARHFSRLADSIVNKMIKD